MKTTFVIFFGLVLAVILCNAQPVAVTPAFEVATVKEVILNASPGMDGGPGTDKPTRFSATGNLLAFLAKAWGISRYEVSGSLDTSKFYEIKANVPEGATAQDFRLMLQSLLVERFGLVSHREDRELSVLNLVVGKDGPKLKTAHYGDVQPATVNESKALAEAPSPHDLGLKMQGAKTPEGLNVFLGTAKSMGALAAFLETPMRKKVVDKTGLEGVYSFSLELDLAEIVPAGIPGHEFAVQSGQPSALPGPTTVSQALNKLGLKLDPAKIVTSVLVVDGYRKIPTAN